MATQEQVMRATMAINPMPGHAAWFQQELLKMPGVRKAKVQDFSNNSANTQLPLGVVKVTVHGGDAEQIALWLKLTKPMACQIELYHVPVTAVL